MVPSGGGGEPQGSHRLVRLHLREHSGQCGVAWLERVPGWPRRKGTPKPRLCPNAKERALPVKVGLTILVALAAFLPQSRMSLTAMPAPSLSRYPHTPAPYTAAHYLACLPAEACLVASPPPTSIPAFHSPQTALRSTPHPPAPSILQPLSSLRRQDLELATSSDLPSPLAALSAAESAAEGAR
jgi:hypothetical protein